MASIVKIKRSSVRGKDPTISDILPGELALNTNDGKLFSTDGVRVFEIGANLHSIDVGAGTIRFGNNQFTFPSYDGQPNTILTTDGSGNLTWREDLFVRNVTITGNTTLGGDLQAKTLTVGNNSTFTLPDQDGAALQILQTDGSGTVTWVALEQAEGGGFTRGTLTTFPHIDYFEGGTGTETFVGELGSGGTDVFGVSLGAVYDCMDPNGRIITEDLGALT
jgi:hypothetical protein